MAGRSNGCDPHSRDFLLHYARVRLKEARSNRGQKSVFWMLNCAAKARREALAISPPQGDLFA